MFLPPLPGKHVFPAIVKTEDDRVLAEGYAHVSLSEGYVDFRGPFVPSFFLGTTVKIIRVEEERELNCFIGKAYLSSPDLLRIIGVDKKMLAEVEIESLHGISLSGRASPIVSKCSIFQFVADHLLRFSISVFEISLSKIKFTSTQYFELEEYLQVSLPEPLPLKKLVVQVKDQLLFGQKEIGYRCDIISLPPTGKQALIDYLTSHTIEEEEEQDGGYL